MIISGRASGTLPRGLGIGWRPELAAFITERKDLGFVEVIAETLHTHGPLPAGLDELVERGMPVVPHGVGLGLGGTEPLQPARVAHLAAVAERVRAPLVSEHVAFVRAGGLEAGHLLPVPRTREAMDVLAANVRALSAELAVPLALEHPAALLRWPEADFDEAGFLTELAERTGALLLLDLANLRADQINHGVDPHRFLDALPWERVAYIHVAGGTVRGGLYHDTHTHPVTREVLDLIHAVADRWADRNPPPPDPARNPELGPQSQPQPQKTNEHHVDHSGYSGCSDRHNRSSHAATGFGRIPAIMLERDGRYPSVWELTGELNTIAAAAGHNSGPNANTSPSRNTRPARNVSLVGNTRPAGNSRPDGGTEPGRNTRTGGSPSPDGIDARPDSGAERDGDTRDGGTAGGLRQTQGELVRALVGGGPAPAGFGHGRVASTRAALLRKRADAAARAWPALSCLPDFRVRFAAFADGRPPAGAYADGVAFARAVRSDLDREARAEQLLAALARRRLAVAMDRRGSGRPLVAVRVPFVGTRVLGLDREDD